MAIENAVTRYQRKTLVRRSFNLNRNTDADLIAYLETVENFQGYIKTLIRKDMQEKQQPTK